MSDTGGNHDLQFFDDEAVDLYDDMLLEAADPINYDFLDKLKNLNPKEVLETNYFESVGSDIEPVVPLNFEEPDLEWVKIKETEELPEDLDDENEGRNEKEVEIDNIEKQKEEDNEKEADEEDDTRSGSSHGTTDSEETTSPSELQDDCRKETELAPWDPSNNETEEKIESFSDVLVESGSVIDYVEFKEKLKELEKRDLQPTAEEPLEDTDQIKAVLFPEIEEPVTEWWRLVDDDLEQDDVKSLNEVPEDSIFTEGENEGFYGLDQKSGGKPDNSEKEDSTPDHSETTSRDNDPKNLDADKPESEETPSKVITSAGNSPINEEPFDTSADVGKKIPEFADHEMQVMERIDPEVNDSCRDLDNERVKLFATSSGMAFAMILQEDVVSNKNFQDVCRDEVHEMPKQTEKSSNECESKQPIDNVDPLKGEFVALEHITSGDSIELSAKTTSPSDSPKATDLSEVFTEVTPIDLDVEEPEKTDVVFNEEKPKFAKGVEEPATTLGVETSDVVVTRFDSTQEVDDEEDEQAKELLEEARIEAELQAQAPCQDTVPTESSQVVAKVDLSEKDPEDFDALKNITASDSVKLSPETTTPSDRPEATDVLEVLSEITPIDLDVAEPEKADVVPDEQKPQVATGGEEPATTLGVKTSDVVMTRIKPSEEVDDEQGVLAKEIFVEPGIEAELQAQAPSQDTVPTESSQAVAKVDLSEQDPEEFDALKDIHAGDSVNLSAETTTPSDNPEATDVLEVLTEITPIDLDVAEPEKADVVPDQEKPQVATDGEKPATTHGVKTSDVVMTRIEPSEEVDDEQGVLAKEIFVEPGIEAELQAQAPCQDTVPTESSQVVAKVDMSEKDPEDFDALKNITASDSVKLSPETTTPSESPEATYVLEVLTEITPIDLDVAEPEKADVVPDQEKPQVATDGEEPATTHGVKTSDVVMTRIEPSEEVDDEQGVLAKEIFVEPGIEAELQAQAPSQDTVPIESSQVVAKVDLSEKDPEDFDALKDITAGDSVKLSAETTTPSDSPEATDVLEVLTEITPIDLDVAEPEKADGVPDQEKPQVATGGEEPATTLGVKTSDVVMTRIEPSEEVDDEQGVLAKEIFVEPGIEAELQAQAPSQDTVPIESSQVVAKVDLSEKDPEDFDALKDITAGDSVKLSPEATTPSDSPQATDVLEVLTEVAPIDLDVAEPEKADVVPDQEKPQVATGGEEPATALGVKMSDVVMTRIEPSEEVDDEEGTLAKELFVEPGIEAELQAHAPSQDTVPTESSQAVAKVDLSEKDPEDFDALKDITAGDSVKLSAETTTPSDSPEATDVLEVLTEVAPIDLDVAEPEKADVVPDEQKPQVATGGEEPGTTLGVKTSDVVMTRIEPLEEVDDEEDVLAKELFVEPGIEAELQAHAPSQDTVPTESSQAVAKVDFSEQDPEEFDALKDIHAGDSVKLSAETTTASDRPEATDVLDVAEPEKADVVPDEQKPQVATGGEEPATTHGVKTSDVVKTRIEPTEDEGLDNASFVETTEHKYIFLVDDDVVVETMGVPGLVMTCKGDDPEGQFRSDFFL